MSHEKNQILKSEHLFIKKEEELTEHQSIELMDMEQPLFETEQKTNDVVITEDVRRIGDVCLKFGTDLYLDSVRNDGGVVKPLMDHAKPYASDNALEVGSSVGSMIKNFFVSKYHAVKKFFSRQDKHISDSSRELAQSIERVSYDTIKKGGEIGDAEAIDESLEKMLRLSQASDMYYDTHRRTRKTVEGAAIKELNNELRSNINKALKNMLTPEEEKQIHNNNVKNAPGEIIDMSKVEKAMKTFGQQYRYFALELGRESVMNTPRQRLELKLRFFSKYEREIKLYRGLYKHLGADGMDTDAKYAIESYENCLRWKLVLDKMPVKKQKEADEKLQAEMYSAVEEATSKEDDRVKLERQKADEGNDGLTADQLKGIDEIDKWLVRNYSNGGLKGILFAKNPHFDLMNQLFSMTKRQRLMAYYLVSSNRRKNPSVLDAAVSQGFVPDLNEFKDRMLATKWAFWKRIDGSYTYMHKLASAFSYTREHTKEIESMKELTKKQASKGDPSPAGQKKGLTIMLYKNLSEYQAILQKGAKEKDKKKLAELEIQAKKSAIFCEGLITELTALDKTLPKTKVENKEFRKSDMTTQTGTFGGFSSFAPMGIKMGMDKTQSMFGWGWGMDKAGWNEMHLWTGSFQSSLSMVGASISVVGSIWALTENQGSMSAEDVAHEIAVITRKGAEVIKSGATFVTGFLGAETAKAAAEIAGKSFSVVKAATTGVKLATEVTGLVKGSKAKKKSDKFFYGQVAKRIGTLDEKTGKRVGKIELNEKEKREDQYNQRVSKLSDELRSRDKLGCFFTSIEFVGDTIDCVIPIVGKVISYVGLGLKKLFTGKYNQSIRDYLFDSYYNVAEVRDKMIASLKKRYPGDEMKVNQLSFQITEAVRRKVAVQAGFADKTSATEHVARRYSEYIRAKLFDDIPASEEEKDALVNLLKSMGIKFNKEKKKPDLEVMIRKMCTK